MRTTQDYDVGKVRNYSDAPVYTANAHYVFGLWSIAMFSIDNLIIYSLAVYGGSRLRA